jgi:hypothetical protein
VHDGVSVAPVDEPDRVWVIAKLVSAFLEDPVERWLFPEAQEYLAPGVRVRVLRQGV